MTISTLDMDITERCNLACRYCYKSKKNGRTIDIHRAKEIVRWFLSIAQGDTFKINFFGGEVFLEWALVQQIVWFAEDEVAKQGKKIKFGITTNLTLLDPGKAAFCKRNGISVHSSIDGCEEAHNTHRIYPDGQGSYNDAAAGAIFALYIKPNDSARFTVSPDTVQYLFKGIMNLLAVGYKNMAPVLVWEADWTEESWQQYEFQIKLCADLVIGSARKGRWFHIKPLHDAIKGITKPVKRQYHCGAGRTLLATDIEGGIWPCHRFTGVNNEHDEMFLGDIDTFDPETLEPLRQIDCRAIGCERCDDCSATNSCGIGCIAVNWETQGSLIVPHPNYCRDRNIAFKQGLRIVDVLTGEENSVFQKRYRRENNEGNKS